MPIKLMYITNNTDVALVAQEAGTDRIFIDLEVISKRDRQKGRDSVISDHSLDDILPMKKALRTADLLVRVNPLYEGSEYEINRAVAGGADVVMLPMYRTAAEAWQFIRLVDGRAKTCLLLETREADECLDDVLGLHGIDEIFIGLNDLHLSYKKTFMFELLVDGTVERICNKLRQKGMFYGFGGMARVGYGMLPAECNLAEHYRLGSRIVILSRSFCDANQLRDLDIIEDRFMEGISTIRRYEQRIADWTINQFFANQIITHDYVDKIVLGIQQAAAK